MRPHAPFMRHDDKTASWMMAVAASAEVMTQWCHERRLAGICEAVEAECLRQEPVIVGIVESVMEKAAWASVTADCFGQLTCKGGDHVLPKKWGWL